MVWALGHVVKLVESKFEKISFKKSSKFIEKELNIQVRRFIGM